MPIGHMSKHVCAFSVFYRFGSGGMERLSGALWNLALTVRVFFTGISARFATNTPGFARLENTTLSNLSMGPSTRDLKT